jgi:propionyl-CoA carboxylase beta chain
MTAGTDAEALARVRDLLSYLPLNNTEDPPRTASKDPADRAEPALDTIVPENPNRPYDMKDVIGHICRRREDARNPTGLRAEYSVRIRPDRRSRRRHRGESTRGARRRSRYRRLDEGRAFRPLLRLLQHPARGVRRRSRFLPGVSQERGGIIRHGAKLLYAFCEATVPRITVITRKAYGGAYDVLNSKHIRGDSISRGRPPKSP